MDSITPAAGLEFEAPILELEAKIKELRSFSESTEVDLSGQIEELENKCAEKKKAIYGHLTPWQRVQIARHAQRPMVEDYIKLMVTDFMELHGDKAYGNDPAILSGLGRIGNERFMIIGNSKGKNTREKIACNFGSAHPEGYRKAMNKMAFAEKFNIPILTFINTPGAFPGLEAEERGQAFVVAQSIMEMAQLRVPIICVVIGEGGSGGALAIGVGDRLLMLENSYYSVITPEGCAAILWKDAAHANKAAEILKLTAQDLKGFGIIDEILPEPLGGAHRNQGVTSTTVEKAILEHLEELKKLSPEELVEQRFQKYAAIGEFTTIQQDKSTG